MRARRRLLEVVLARRQDDLDALATAAREQGVPVRRAEPAELDALAQGVRHQGAVALAPPFAYRRLAELPPGDLVCVLDGITDPQNLGAIARSAELAGASGLVLRERRSVGVTPGAEKASAGAFSWLPVAQVTNIVRAVDELAARGYWSVGLDEDAPDPLWGCPLLDGPVALVVGAEGEGLSRLVRDRVDARVRIPTAGKLGSLNASAAAAVALFECRRIRGHEASAQRTSGS